MEDKSNICLLILSKQKDQDISHTCQMMGQSEKLQGSSYTF